MENDLKKNELIQNTDLFLIRIREHGLPPINIPNDATLYCTEGNERELNAAITNLFKIIQDKLNLKEVPIINIQKDRIHILNQYVHREIEVSLGHSNPEILKLWHPTKNGKLKPIQFTEKSGKKVWWKCEKGHEWEAQILKITDGRRCPYCSNKSVGKDNCLAVTHPELSEEWHPTKNGYLTAYDVVPGSGKKIWWKCKNGHEWQNVVNKRAIQGQSCADCHGRGRITATLESAKKIFAENGCELLAKKFINSSTKMKYKCSCGNISETTLSRFKTGRRCSSCKGKRISETKSKNQSC